MATTAEDRVRSPDHEQELDQKIKEIQRKNREIEKRKEIVAEEAKANGIPKAITTRAEGSSSKSAGRGRRLAGNREWDAGKLPAEEWKKSVPGVENNKGNGEPPKNRNAARNGPPLGGRGRPQPPLPHNDANNGDPLLRGPPRLRPPRDSPSGGTERGVTATKTKFRSPPPCRNRAFFHDDRSNAAPPNGGDSGNERVQNKNQPRRSRPRHRSISPKNGADKKAVDGRGQGGGRGQNGGQPSQAVDRRKRWEEKQHRAFIRRQIKRHIKERRERQARNKALGIKPVAQPLGPGKVTTRKEYQIISKVLFKLVRRVCYQMGEYKPKGTTPDGKPYFETKRRDVSALQSIKDDEEEVAEKFNVFSMAENGTEKAMTEENKKEEVKKSESTDELKRQQLEEKEKKEELKVSATEPKEEAELVDKPTEKKNAV